MRECKLLAALLLLLIAAPPTCLAGETSAKKPLKVTTTSSSLTLRHILHRPTSGSDPAVLTGTVRRGSPQWAATTDAMAVRNYPVKHAKPRSPTFQSPSSRWAVQGGGARIASTVGAAETPARKAIVAPDVTDKGTVVALADMTADAYLLPDLPDWLDAPNYHTNISFGWKEDGLRGYVFANDDDSLLVLAIKGTTAGFLGIGGITAPKDKLNDNRMFSCCCARVDRTWTPVCDCFAGNGVCNSTCLAEAVHYEHSYYHAGRDLYLDITQKYPHATVWFTGHSLGGAISSLLAATYNLPAVAFEAPGELMFARRLGLALPTDQSMLDIYHFGHNADPIFLGTCRGPRSSCYYAGFALETSCHVGHTCMYDARQADDSSKRRSQATLDPPPSSTTTTTSDPSEPTDEPDLHWGVDIRHHRIHEVIDKVITQFPTVPPCLVDSQCRDCQGWTFV
ncbi:putative lipase atg15 [Sorochytrium milnesiophthora]